MILDAQPGIEVVGEAADGRDAVALARDLRPDVCLLDIRMPELDGIEATRALAGPDVDGPAGRRRHHHVRPRRVRLRRAAGRRPRLPAQGRRPRAAHPGRPRGRQRRRADRPERHRPPAGRVRRRSRDAPPAQPIEPLTAREEQVLVAVARGLHQRRDRRRALHLPQHGEDAPRQPHGQARRPQPGRDRHLGL